MRRFVLTALAIYVVLPAAPPWAALTGPDVAHGPSYPNCMFSTPAGVPDGGLLGAMQATQPGARQFVERILHPRVCDSAPACGTGPGQLRASQRRSVAAIPSLHAALSVMIAAFCGVVCSADGLVAYVLMAFTLVYSAEHYVIDILLGWAVVAWVIRHFEARRSAAPDEPPPHYDQRRRRR